MVLGDAEETITIVEIDAETQQETVKVRHGSGHARVDRSMLTDEVGAGGYARRRRNGRWTCSLFAATVSSWCRRLYEAHSHGFFPNIKMRVPGEGARSGEGRQGGEVGEGRGRRGRAGKAGQGSA